MDDHITVRLSIRGCHPLSHTSSAAPDIRQLTAVLGLEKGGEFYGHAGPDSTPSAIDS